MPVAIEAALDIAAICNLLVLIGMLLAVRYTFQAAAVLFDIGILGVHPFRHLAVLLRNTIIRWCQAGIDESEKLLHDLLHGLAWSVEYLGRSLHALAQATEHALTLLRHEELPGLLRAERHLRIEAEQALSSRIGDLRSDLNADIRKLERTITSAEQAAVRTAESYAANLVATAERDLLGRLSTAEQGLAGAIRAGVNEAEAEAAAVAAELAKLEQLVPPLTLAALIAAFPLLQAAVVELEAETGLDNPGCRSKVKGICATNPSGWLNMLAGLALLTSSLRLADLYPIARKGVEELAGAVEGLG